jgi:hypothetical protein
MLSYEQQGDCQKEKMRGMCAEWIITNIVVLFSESKPFPTSASGGQGCVWQSAHCGEERHWLDVRPEVYSQR